MIFLNTEASIICVIIAYNALAVGGILARLRVMNSKGKFFGIGM